MVNTTWGYRDGEGKWFNVGRPVGKHLSGKSLEVEVEIMRLRNNYAEIRPITYFDTASNAVP